MMVAPQLTIMQGDALEKLRELPSESVQLVITSPPYWGLRDYGTAKWEGGNPECDHQYQKGGRNPKTAGKQLTNKGTLFSQYEDVCGKCGAIRSDNQLGLEKTPDEYVIKLVEIFREVRRVLRSDGVVWLNLGDSYYGSWGNSGSRNGGQRPTNVDGYDRKGWDDHTIRPAASYDHPILKPKDQCLIPHRVAIALQADGWWIRQSIIWNKSNPMPESCTDRCTTSHEYIFHLTKSAHYFYDQDAIREPFNYPDRKYSPDTINHKTLGLRDIGNRSTVGLHDGRTQYGDPKAGRNKRSVWTMSTKPYPEAHFATFPPELPETCIKAGTSQKGCCPNCGAPWVRVIDKDRPDDWKDAGPQTDKEKELREQSKAIYGGNQKSRSISDIYGRATKSEIKTTGWQPTCSCGIEETIPCTVLDIFAGSGTTGEVARGLGRSCILIELNPEYIKLIKERTKYALKAVDSFV